MPPSQTKRDEGAAGHICRNIGVDQDPVIRKGPRGPCASLGLNGLDIVIDPSIWRSSSFMLDLKLLEECRRHTGIDGAAIFLMQRIDNRKQSDGRQGNNITPIQQPPSTPSRRLVPISFAHLWLYSQPQNELKPRGPWRHY